MAQIYNKTTVTGTEQSLILGSQEAYLCPFNVGTWNNIRVGAYISIVDSTIGNGNGSWVPENILLNTTKTSMYFGIKDNTSLFPGTGSSVFAGVCTDFYNSLNSTGTSIISSADILNNNYYISPITKLGKAFGSLGTIYISGGILTQSNITAGSTSLSGSIILPPITNTLQVSAVSSFCMPYFLDYTIHNRGLSCQALEIKTPLTHILSAESNPTVSNLRSFMAATPAYDYSHALSTVNIRPTITYNNLSFGYHLSGSTVTACVSDVPWLQPYSLNLTNNQFISGAPLAVPNAVFVYNPFINNSIRIHCIAVELVS